MSLLHCARENMVCIFSQLLLIHYSSLAILASDGPLCIFSQPPPCTVCFLPHYVSFLSPSPMFLLPIMYLFSALPPCIFHSLCIFSQPFPHVSLAHYVSFLSPSPMFLLPIMYLFSAPPTCFSCPLCIFSQPFPHVSLAHYVSFLSPCSCFSHPF